MHSNDKHNKKKKLIHFKSMKEYEWKPQNARAVKIWHSLKMYFKTFHLNDIKS